MDGSGQGQTISLLSKACRDEDFAREELSPGNLESRHVVPLLDNSYKPRLKPVKQIEDHVTTSPPPSCSWVNFTFSCSALAALKLHAMESVTSEFISTDDALGAVIWQSITRARQYRLEPTAESTFSRVVDMRRFLSIPQTYPGVVVTRAFTKYQLQDLVGEPIGTISARLRSNLDPETLAYTARAQATGPSRAADKAKVSGTSPLNPSLDVNCSSWAELNYYKLDFGPALGTPEAVRRPRFSPRGSLLYLFPKTLGGDITVCTLLKRWGYGEVEGGSRVCKVCEVWWLIGKRR